MPECVFITGVADVADYAARLVRKKHKAGEAFLLLGPLELLRRVDHLLWAGDPGDFIAHWLVQGSCPPGVVERTRIWLAAGVAELPPDAPVPASVAHLGGEDEVALRPFGRIADIVASDAASRQAGRARWRAYEAGGWRLTHHVVDARN